MRAHKQTLTHTNKHARTQANMQAHKQTYMHTIKHAGTQINTQHTNKHTGTLTCRHTNKHAQAHKRKHAFKDNSNRTVLFLYYHNFYKSFGSICSFSRNTKVQIPFNAFLMENIFFGSQISSPNAYISNIEWLF